MMRMCTVVLVCALAAACSSGGGGPDAAQQHLPVCGDSVCEPAEVGSCMADCGNGGHANPVCGNNMCEQGETAQSCPGDCGPKCGDNVCDMAGGENQQNCPSDCMGGGSGGGTCPANLGDCFLCAAFNIICPSGQTQTGCQQCIFSGGGAPGCVGGFPDGTCDMAGGENNTTCPTDCP